MPTIIVIAEYFIVKNILKLEVDFSRLPGEDELPNFSRPAVYALVAGCMVGTATAGVVPGLEFLHVGVCSVQGWLCAIAVYLIFRLRESRLEALAEVPIAGELLEEEEREGGAMRLK